MCRPHPNTVGPSVDMSVDGDLLARRCCNPTIMGATVLSSA